METPIDFYRHFSWLKKVSAELWFHFFVSFLVSHSFCWIGALEEFSTISFTVEWRAMFIEEKKRGEAPLSVSDHYHRSSDACYCPVLIVWFPGDGLFSDVISFSSRAGAASQLVAALIGRMCAWRHASQGLCYLIKGIIHQLIVVDKAASDTAGFNQRETLPPESRAVVRTWSFRNNSVEFRLCFCFVSEFSKRIILAINQRPPKSVWIRQMSLYLSSRQCFFFYFFFYCGLQLTYTDHSFDTTLWYDGLNQTEKSVKKKHHL